MAGWSTPKTWATGNSITAALLNTNIGDNFRALLRPIGLEDDWAYPDSLPNPITDIQMQCGADDFTCNASSEIRIEYPVAFPHGTVNCMVTDVGGAGYVTFHPVIAKTTNYYSTFSAFNSSSDILLGGPVVVNLCWIAFGF